MMRQIVRESRNSMLPGWHDDDDDDDDDEKYDWASKWHTILRTELNLIIKDN